MGVVADVALCVIFAISIISGAVKGFVKQLSGFLRGIVALVCAILLTALIIKLLRTAPLYESFVGVTTGWFQGEAMSIVVSTQEELSAALALDNTMRILSGLSAVFFKDMQTFSAETLPCNTIGLLLGHYVADLICGFILWLALLLIIQAIFKGLISLMKNIIIMPAFKTLDRILGAVWSLAFTYAILIAVILAALETAFIKFLPDTWDKMADFIQNTTVLLWLHDTNVIGSLIASLLNVEIPSLTVQPLPAA